MDNTLRDLERRLKQNPDDTQVIIKLMQTRIRMGEEVKVSFKIRSTAGAFFKTGYPSAFTTAKKGGSIFKSREDAFSALQKTYDQSVRITTRRQRYPHDDERADAQAFLKACVDCEIVKFQTCTLEVEGQKINMAEETKQKELAKIRKQRLDLEQREQDLLSGKEPAKPAKKQGRTRRAVDFGHPDPYEEDDNEDRDW